PHHEIPASHVLARSERLGCRWISSRAGVAESIVIGYLLEPAGSICGCPSPCGGHERAVASLASIFADSGLPRRIRSHRACGRGLRAAGRPARVCAGTSLAPRYHLGAERRQGGVLLVSSSIHLERVRPLGLRLRRWVRRRLRWLPGLRVRIRLSRRSALLSQGGPPDAAGAQAPDAHSN